MKTKLMAALGAMVLMAAAVFGAIAVSTDAEAQKADHYEYGYLVPVPRIESYEIETSRWAGSAEDKKFMEAHVFAYEEGANNFDRRVNGLRRMNELAAQGWEVCDAEAGLLRRKK
jgi:ABC-type glycerol-3-phosphate transport system substrate-binding protein